MSKWVCTWGVPTSYVCEDLANVIENSTLRYTFFNNLKGNKIRFNFSNEYGKHDAKIDSASVGEWSGRKANIIKETCKEITFSQNGNVIKAGKQLVSDEIEYEMQPGKTYVISLYFKEKTFLETGYYKLTTELYCAFGRGNYVFEGDMADRYSLETKNYMFLSGADVYTDDDSYAVIAFGDSITALQWPDLIQKKLFENGKTGISFVRRAVSGNRVLSDFGDISRGRHQAAAAVKRIERDINQSVGAKTLVLLEGINDLLFGDPKKPGGDGKIPTADELINGYKKCFEICRKYGLKTYQGPILPSGQLTDKQDDRDEKRLVINEWIRKCECTDGCIDYAEKMKEEDNGLLLKAEYDRGDRLHPNIDGEAFMAELVYETVIGGQK